MSLLRVSALRAAVAAAEGEGSPGSAWLPSHVQVTVAAARGLRLKGGPGDAFAVLQLGRQKHRTSVATLRGGGGGGGGDGDGPRWGEECALELPPAVPGETDAAALLLQLTVWQRALVGLDRFLGRAVVPLGPLLQAGRAHPDQWHRLHSKPGKKEKERGEIQVSIHFTRHSLTASMFDLSVKDKPRSPFGKLRDKMKGRRQYDLESASAIVPSSSGALEEDLGGGSKRTKGSGFFFKNKLRKSSLTQSSTSLGSDSTVSSASSMVGMAALEAGVAPSPSRHGSLPADRSVRDFLPSPKLTHKRAFSDEASQINTLPESRSVQSLKPQSEPISRSSLCINGSHIYCEEPSPRPAASSPSATAASLCRPQKPAESSSPGLPAPEAELPPWPGSSFPRPPQKDPPRFIPSPPILAAQEEDKLSVKTLALHKQRSRAKMGAGAQAEGRPVQIATPMVFSTGAGKGRPPEEAPKEETRAKAGFFRRGGTKEDAGKSVGGPEGEKSSSWFSMKDAQDPSRRPSSPPALLAVTEATQDTCVCEDRGLSAFPGAGTPQPGSAPQSRSAFEPAAAAAPPLEWGDPFEAFATSRLRPGAQREPLHRDATAAATTASEGLADHDRLEEDGPPPHISAGPPLRWPSEPEGSPSEAPAGTVVRGESPPRVETGPGHSPSGPCEEAALSGVSPDWEEPPLAARGAETADLWGETWQSPAAGGPPVFAGPHLPLSPAVEHNTSRESPRSSPTESKLERPATLPLGTGSTTEAERGEAAALGAARQEQAALQMPPAPGEAEQPGGRAEEGRGVPGEGGEGGQGTDAAPPKPPRRFTPLRLEEEASEVPWGARPRRESQEGPRGGAGDGPGPPGGDGSTPWAIGAGGGSGGRGSRGLPLPAAAAGPADANELTRQAGPLGDSEPAAGAGAGGAEQLETCPGQPGLAGAAGEPLSASSSGLGSPQVPGPLPVAEEEEEGGLGPSGAPWGPEPSPSVLFWSALEEQPLQPPDGAPLEQPRGHCGGLPNPEPSLEQGGGAGLAWPEPDRVGSPPAGSARGRLQQGPRGSPASDSERSSSWSDDRVVDFKKADFWQAEGGEEGSAPGNPFVSRVSPQNNPFVARPPGALPALQGPPLEGPGSFRDFHAEAAPLQGLLPAPPSQGLPPAPSLHDNRPLAFSTPSLEEEEAAAAAALGGSRGFAFPSPIVPPAPGEGSAAGGLPAACLPLALPSPSTDATAASSASPTEPQPADQGPAQRTTSPHPVKPLSTSRPLEKQRRSSLPLGQEKLKPEDASSAPVLPLEKADLKRDPAPPGCSAKYSHLTRDELIQLLLRREAELGKKQEHIRELEAYIDRLLVRIMEQSPTLLQIPLGGGAKAAK